MSDFMSTDAALRRFTERLRDYAVVLLDTGGLVTSWNAGASLLKGYTAAEVIGQHFGLFYTPQARAVGHPERELAVASSVGRYEEEGWRVRKDGTQFWAHIVLLPVLDDDQVLRGFGKVVRDATAIKQSTEQSANVMNLLEFTARTDYLTGLDNRRSLDKELLKLLSAASRHTRPLSLAMIDLDHFKTYNDEFGHQAGDAYLKRAAAAWRSSIREEDFIARYGGEEFLVVLPDADVTGALESMERLRAVTPGPLTCSVGLAEWDGLEAADKLIGRADRSLYQAKETGRNRIVAAANRAPAESIALTTG